MTPRRRYHFHLPGVIYIFITVLLAVGAFNSQNNLLFWAFGFALAILLVSGLISGAMLMGVTIEREAPPPATASEPLVIRYRVHNRNRLMPAFALHLAELAPGHDEPRRRRRRRRRSQGGIAAGEPDWSSHLSPIRGFVAHVGPGQTVVCEAPARALRRGVATLSVFRVQTTFPFGLVRKSLEAASRRTVIIRPRIIPPADPSIVSASQRHSRGVSRPSARVGEGEEFFALREYAPGDSLRTVAWKRSARSEKLHVRQNAAMLPDRLWVGVAAAAEEEAFERALGEAAGLIDEASRREIEVGLLIPAANVHVLPRAGAAHRERLMDELALAVASPARADPVRVAERVVVVGGPGAEREAGVWPGHAMWLQAGRDGDGGA